MSSILRSASFRSVRQKDFSLSSVESHEFLFSPNELQYLQGNFDLLAEMGGVQGIAAVLRTDVKNGLHQDEVTVENGFTRRKELYGANIYPSPPLKTFIEFCLEGLSDPMLILLMIAGSVSIIVGTIEHPDDGWYEGVAILFAVALVTLIGATNNYNQQKRFAELDRSEEFDKCSVIRNKQTLQLAPDQILVGDIVILAAGAFIPADGILVADDNIKVNESKMTGESIDIVKNFYDPFLSGGTEVREGQCTMLVTAVGAKSAYGRILAALAHEPESTPLQLKLEAVAKFVGYLGSCVAIALFIVLMARWIADRGPGSEVIDIFIVCVTIIVVAVPEGLPLAVTISLAYSMKAMQQDNIVVHKLAACETMGNATTICSDKTGTLTQNLMTVVKVWLGGQFFDGIPTKEQVNPIVKKLLIEGVVVNSKAWIDEVDMKNGVQPELWLWKDGNQTEVALMSWLTRYDIDISGERSKYPVEKSYPFDSIKKQSSVILSHSSLLSKMTIQRQASRSTSKRGGLATSNSNNAEKKSVGFNVTHGDGSSAAHANADSAGFRRYFKGAAEVIVETCSRSVDRHGNAAEMSPSDKNDIIETINRMTRRGLRTIAFSYVDYPSLQRDEDDNIVDPEQSTTCTFLGCVGIKDPLRVEAYRSVRQCQKAGVIVRMVTGDHLETAKFISRECGILTSEKHICMLGQDFRKMIALNNENQLCDVIPRLRVLARSKPEDKEALVNWLRKHDQVVASTGDGTNDAPALSAADVGIAMFIAGTSVAKAAAQIWILDDNFTSIVKAVMWGRAVYDNIRKFVQFQLTVNIVALGIALIGALAGFGEPLTAVQLLWVNLIMDTFAALALGTEPPDARLLKRRPYKLKAFIISPVMWRNIFLQAALQLTVLLLILYAREYIPKYNQPLYVLDSSGNETTTRALNKDGDAEFKVITRLQLYTILFNTFVFFQLFNEINSRKVNAEYNVFEKIFVNPIFVGVWIMTAGVQAILVEFGGSFSQTEGLTGLMWLFCILVGASALPWGCIVRLIPVNYEYGMVEISEETFAGAQLKDTQYSEKRPDISLKSIKQVQDNSEHNMEAPITQPTLNQHQIQEIINKKEQEFNSPNIKHKDEMNMENETNMNNKV